MANQIKDYCGEVVRFFNAVGKQKGFQDVTVKVQVQTVPEFWRQRVEICHLFADPHNIRTCNRINIVLSSPVQRREDYRKVIRLTS